MFPFPCVFSIFPFFMAIPFVMVFIVIIKSISNARTFQHRVFNKIDHQLYQKVDQAPKPNRHYIKLRCDNCGAKCTNAKDISPSGDLRCEYCDTWFNVLRSDGI